MKVFAPWGYKVKIGLSDKLDGNMRDFGERSDEVVTNQNRVLKSMDVAPESAVRVLGKYEREDFARYFAVDSAGDFAMTHGENGVVNDGILTQAKDLAIFLPLADCLGVILFDVKQDILTMVHCGRHNLEQNGLTKAVEFMTQNAGSQPADVKVWFSPSAGAENYPLYNFDNKSMAEVTVEQLTHVGVLENNITKSVIDTTTDPNYFSHSQGDKTSRFAIVAVMPCPKGK